MKKYINYILILAVLAVLMGKFGVSRETYVHAEEPVISHQQLVWLYTLENCESAGRDDLKIMDSNNRYSFSVLQFQMETFLREGKKYSIINQDITPKQAEDRKMIYSIDLQEKIAHQMLLNGGEANWLNCWKSKLKTKYPN